MKLALGRLIQATGQLGIFVGLFNLFLLLITMTTSEGFRYFMTAHGLSVPMWSVFVGVSVFMVVGLLAAYKYAVPSSFLIWNQKWWNEGNLLKGEIETLQKQNRLILHLLSKSEKTDGCGIFKDCKECPIKERCVRVS
jgi:hypothetical protein